VFFVGNCALKLSIYIHFLVIWHTKRAYCATFSPKTYKPTQAAGPLKKLLVLKPCGRRRLTFFLVKNRNRYDHEPTQAARSRYKEL
jgi:hypothetical protein